MDHATLIKVHVIYVHPCYITLFSYGESFYYDSIKFLLYTSGGRVQQTFKAGAAHACK